MESKSQKRDRRHRRIRAKVKGTAERPRLAVFRSNRAIYAQLIDDQSAMTIAYATSAQLKGKSTAAGAREVGKIIAVKAKEKNVERAVFDRGGYMYAGAVKAVAEGAREGGLSF